MIPWETRGASMESTLSSFEWIFYPQVAQPKSQMLLQSNTSPNSSRCLGISQTCQSSILSELPVKEVLSLMGGRITFSVYWIAASDLARSTSTWKPLYRMGGSESWLTAKGHRRS